MRETHPHLAEEFHPTKNGDYTPDNLTAGSHKRVWWICSTCENEWITIPSNRNVLGHGCPCCARKGNLHSDGRNSLRNTHPELVKEFHPNKNGDITLDNVTAGTGKRIWWVCSTCNHEWNISGSARTHGDKPSGCPFCNGGAGFHRVVHSDGRNSMRNTHPHLVAEFHPTKNGDYTPDNLQAFTNKKVWWLSSNCSHEWKAVSNSRASGGNGCPACANQVLHVDGRNSLAKSFPIIAKEFHPTKNAPITPETIVGTTEKHLWWVCSNCDHEWLTKGKVRCRNGAGCPACSNRQVHLDGRNSMAVTHPHLAIEYQGDATKIIATGAKRRLWKCSTCNYKWRTSGDKRVAGRRCPSCVKGGFTPTLEGYLYLMEYERVNKPLIYKIGISHNVEERRRRLLASLRKHQGNDAQINIIDTMYFDVGEDAMEMEKTFHAMEEHRFTPKKKFEGWTEMFKASIVDVWNRMVKI